jgi:acetyl-CoA carboxylase, biotin carboxylase subunit
VGYAVPPFYDSLLGKMIVHAPDRAAAIARMGEALSTLDIGGIKTTVPLHAALAANEDVRAGRFDTKWLEPWLAGNPLRPETTKAEHAQ